MKYLFRLLPVLILSILLLTGCSPQGDPTEIITSYYESVKNGDFEAAYALLSDENKQSVSKEDFIEFQTSYNDGYQNMGSVVSKTKELTDFKPENKVFKNAIEYKVVDTIKSYYDGKETKFTYNRYVVNENGTWKIYRIKEDSIKEGIAYHYIQIGWMYFEGKGKTKDLNQAAIYFSKAIETDPEISYSHYCLSVVYNDLQRYEESINAAKDCIERATTDKELQSDAYNVIGNNNSSIYKMDEARLAYKKAIELNPNNEYAKTNLKNLD